MALRGLINHLSATATDGNQHIATDKNMNKGFAIQVSIEEVVEKIKTGYLKIYKRIGPVTLHNNWQSIRGQSHHFH
jgi:hypothetical protein